MRFLMILVLVLGVAALVSPVSATPVTLTDCNSTFVIDPTNDNGAVTWTVDGADQLFKQQWYYRLASGGVNSINALGTPAVSTSGANGVNIVYTQSGFEVSLGYILTGGSEGSYTSDVAELFRIKNNGTTPLNFGLFEYSDFDLYPTASGDYAEHLNANAVRQWDGWRIVTESVSRQPDRWQVSNPFTVTGDLTNASALIGPTDCAWAFQWNMVVAPGSSILLSKDKTFSTNVPEPMSVLLGVMGLATVAGYRRSRMK